MWQTPVQGCGKEVGSPSQKGYTGHRDRIGFFLFGSLDGFHVLENKIWLASIFINLAVCFSQVYENAFSENII